MNSTDAAVSGVLLWLTSPQVLGAGLALLVWMYVWSVITLIGCEFNAARERLMAPVA